MQAVPNLNRQTLSTCLKSHFKQKILHIDQKGINKICHKPKARLLIMDEREREREREKFKKTLKDNRINRG